MRVSRNIPPLLGLPFLDIPYLGDQGSAPYDPLPASLKIGCSTQLREGKDLVVKILLNTAGEVPLSSAKQ